MIIPEIYEDELLYSFFCRCYVRNGFLIYRQMAEYLFLNKKEKPDILFVNGLRPEIRQQLEKQKSWSSIIKDNTMYSFYSKFLENERKEKAYKALCNMEGNYRNLLPVGKARMLCYCSMCVQEDRRKYGETYWHRSHQMEGVKVCPKHRCYLSESNIETGMKQSPCFRSAEMEVAETKIIMVSYKEWEFARYVNEVVCLEDDYKNELSIGVYLDTMLSETKYKSTRGKQRNIALLQEDYKEYWNGTLEKTLEIWQMQHILAGYRFQVTEICTMGMFMGISPKDLVFRTMAENESSTQVEKFDNKVREMLKNGTGINEAARILQVSNKTIRDIRDNKQAPGLPKSRKQKKKDYTQEDIETLPKVKDAIAVLLGKNGERPRRISVYRIGRMLEIPEKRISKFNKCMKLITLHQETVQEYWIREIRWAVDKIEEQGNRISWTQFERLTHMRKSYIIECFDLLDTITQKKIQDIL